VSRERGATRPPATRDQVDAYRFGLRRLEAALVRGDPVPLHEQIRSQRRASLAGVALGMLGLCGVAVYALVVPSPDWRNQDVVVGSTSGSMYAVARAPDRLVPVTNLPAARLVLAALRRGGATDADPGTAVPVPVPDATLDAAPRTATAAVQGAVGVRADGTVVTPRWAVCDEVTADGRVVATTVIGGAVAAPGPPGDGVLLEGPGNSTWLVTAGHRHRLDTGDGRLLAIFGLTRPVPREASVDLVSVVPEGPELATPVVPGRGDPAPGGLGTVGDVLVTRPVGAAPRHFVVLAGGLQEVPDLVAGQLLVAAGAGEARPVDPVVLAATAVVDVLPVAGWPTGSPRMRDAGEAPVVCWTWSPDTSPAGEVWTGGALPVAPGTVPVTLAQADGAGERIDAVAVGAGGAVRSTGPGRAAGAGPLWLVSGGGVGYGVADAATAAALGITAAEPAPEAALRLLPTGPALDLAQAGRVVDVLRTD